MSTSNLTLVTACNQKLFDQFARRNFMQWETYSEVPLQICFEGKANGFKYPEEVEAFAKVARTKTTVPIDPNDYSQWEKENCGGQRDTAFRLAAERFSKKAYAICDAVEDLSTRYFAWVDADVYPFAKVTEEFLISCLNPGDLGAFINREPREPETGFFIFDGEHPKFTEFWNHYKNYYTSRSIFDQKEWTDGYMFHLTTQAIDAPYTRMAGDKYILTNPWISTKLAGIMRHEKGHGKFK